MVEIIYKSLSSLSPVELKYDYYKKEELQANTFTYNNGISLYKINGFNNYRDIVINKDTCFILTSSVNLNSVFANEKTLTIGSTPVSVLIGQRLESGLPPVTFAKYINEQEQNVFKLIFTEVPSVTAASTFYLQPVNNQFNVVEIFVEGKYLQVEENYPYTVKLSERTLSIDSINRQRFEVAFDKKNNFITFKTLTNSGYRYLAFNNDNILRATGLMLNNTAVNDYVLQCVPITYKELNYGFTPTNNWVTYYFDIESRLNNKNLTINKDIRSTKTNLLVSFPVEQATVNSNAVVNLANLKTNLTPSGGSAPINNAYAKEVITAN
jgi:hypothetical protein